MDTNPLFTLALGLAEPWHVCETRFNPDNGRLDLRLAYKDSAHFSCPCCAARDCPVYDCLEREWRHLDFFQHEAHLSARVPRIRCDVCGVKQVTVPWARPGSGFTLLMEAVILEMVRHTPVRAVARMLRVRDKRLWRVAAHYVGQAINRLSLDDLRRIAMDETSARKRHDYISLFFDLDRRRLIYAAEGKDAQVLGHFSDFLKNHGGDPGKVKEVSCDMSPAFIKGVAECLPKASITFDRFHVMKIINDAVDEVRRTEWRKDKAVKGSRYLFLSNPEFLTPEQEATLKEVMSRNAALAEAYRLKETFRDLYQQPDWESGRGFLKAWIIAALKSKIAPMMRAASTIRRHWKGILHWFVSRVSNGIMEGLNSLIQAAKRKARGYRNHSTFIIMAYLIAGKLDFSTHTK